MTKFWQALFLTAIICASAWMFFLNDDGLGIGWTHNAIRNWQQFGLATLHGELVINPGGYEALTNPRVYHGMSPVCFYMVYFPTVLFSWTGLGNLPFHIVMALAVFWAIWEMLGRNRFAVIVAVIVVLSPGYMHWQKMFDPTTTSILPVIPYAAIMLPLLQKQKLNPLLMVVMFLLTLVFMSLNWTTCWVCGPCILSFLGMPGINRRSLLGLILITALSGIIVVFISVAAKSGLAQAGTHSSGLLTFIAGYTWGSNAYGVGLTTGKALIRFVFYNLVTLLPLGLAMSYAIIRELRAASRLPWIAFAPFGLTVVEIFFMRNYFGHHPWAQSPVLLIGAIFSLVLLRALSREKSFDQIAFPCVPAAVAFCFVYGLAVIVFLRANQMDTLSVVSLVRSHTVRSDEIVIVGSADPATANLADRFGEMLDRHVVLVKDFSDIVSAGHCYIISSVPLNGPLTLLGQSSTDDQGWTTKIANWFNHSISRRPPGDRMDLANNYFLYQPK